MVRAIAAKAISAWGREVAAAMTVHDLVEAAFVQSREEIYVYLITLGLDPGAAQELTQEAFLRLHIELEKGTQVRNLRAWAFRVAHNLAVTARSEQRRTQELDAEIENTVACGATDPERALIDKESMRRLAEALNGLSPQQRHCLHLRARGLRYQEIADTIGIAPSTVGEFLQRGIARLRKALHD
jgi:RNA polymerase sigma-70 factor (ECF subfamily)